MSVDVEKIVRENITETVHMSMATSQDNKPWVCEVHFANDDNLNLYFVSKLTTRHCLEIATNSNVAGNIVKQHQLTDSPNGVYFEGTAELLRNPSDDEVERYCKALGRDIDDVIGRLQRSGGHGMYKISVTNWAVFGKFDGDSNQKYELSWNGGEK